MTIKCCPSYIRLFHTNQRITDRDVLRKIFFNFGLRGNEIATVVEGGTAQSQPNLH